MYHEIGARFASVYIHDTEHAAINRVHFYGQLRESLLQKISAMLEKSNVLVKSFVSLRDLMMKGMIPGSVQFVIHAHSKIISDHERKYNVPEASEVAALIVGEQHGKIDIILRRHGTLNTNGGEQLQLIHLGNRMDDPLAYLLLFPYGTEGWHYLLRYTDSKWKLLKVSTMKFHCQLLYQRPNEFNLIIRSGRLYQQYLCEMFVKVESETLSFLRQNQSVLRASDYTRLCELLVDPSMAKNEIQERAKRGQGTKITDVEKLVVLPSTHIRSERYMRQKIYDIISIPNSIGHPDVRITMTCNPYWPEIQNALLPGQKADDRPDLCDRVFRVKLKLLLKLLQDNRLFGRVLAHVSVIEFRKRGHVHSHIILSIDQERKFALQDPLQIDNHISAEIPPPSDHSLR